MPALTLTKFMHSCVLVEHEEATVLFDPGVFSWDSGTFSLDALPRLDAVVITHEHADHFHLPFLQAVLEKFPSPAILAPEPVMKLLEEAGVSPAPAAADMLATFTAPHESLPFSAPGPANLGVHFRGLFTHPGDSHSFKESKQVLAMPMTAPWGSMVSAVDKILELRPKFVLPIHDWHWRPEALQDFYGRFHPVFHEQGIEFLQPVDGKPTELNLL